MRFQSFPVTNKSLCSSSHAMPLRTALCRALDWDGRVTRLTKYRKLIHFVTHPCSQSIIAILLLIHTLAIILPLTYCSSLIKRTGAPDEEGEDLSTIHFLAISCRVIGLTARILQVPSLRKITLSSEFWRAPVVAPQPSPLLEWKGFLSINENFLSSIRYTKLVFSLHVNTVN